MSTDTNEREALLPCPFCGAQPAIKAVARDWWKLLIDHTDGCMLSGHLVDVIVPQDEESKATIISMWNRRAALSTPPAAAGASIVPDHMALVPREPTDAMEVAAENHYEESGTPFPNWKSAWRQMVAAALQGEGNADQAGK